MWYVFYQTMRKPRSGNGPIFFKWQRHYFATRNEAYVYAVEYAFLKPHITTDPNYVTR